MTNQQIILDWMEKNPNRLLRTNCKVLAGCMLLDKDSKLKMTTGSCIQLLQRMLRDNLIIREGGKFRGNFKINYGHPDLPTLMNKKVKVTKTEHKPKEISDDVAKNIAEINQMFEKRLQEPRPIVECPKSDVIMDTSNGEIHLTITLNINLGK